MFKKLGSIFTDIKLTHTVFALPFALASAHIAFDGKYDFKILALILVCMFTARSAAMAFNRWLDRDIDSVNPRTKSRVIPAGIVKPKEMLFFTIACSIAFVVSSFFLNMLAFILSPVALAVILGYSCFKRFTSMSHLVLGLALAIAPVGAWIAIKGEFGILPIILAITVIFWVSGFDIIYSCQDTEFDTRTQLYSFPRRFGVTRALAISTVFHLITIGLLILFGHLLGYGLIYRGLIALIAVILLVEHMIVTPDKLGLIGVAFFTLNGFISIIFYLAVLLDNGRF
ncbi:putative 4-hydroxybenzoate polyprenyltransferase [bacterium]|nr:putative 4-hydroxybenzoate polyprenyltransferase [bacterium]MBU1025549.1 putative 4-hydroxybenzoate polyprenyltransferase [bacterium]